MPRMRSILAGTLWFNAASALGGGISLVTGTLPVPMRLLRNTPFDSFVVPGIVLGVVIGGSALAGALALRARTGSALLVCGTAGLIMVGWITGEAILIEGFSGLQGLYLATGVGVAALSARLLAQDRRPARTEGSADARHTVT